jgi:hypothetical protein
MKALLIGPDSKLPNLALMKIYSYHKSRGDEVGFHVSEPDIVYGSIMFSKNKHIADSWKWIYPNANIIIGGPGYDPMIKLPPEVEKMPPCQDIYADNPYSIYSVGRVTSGCIRKCYFCVVPKLEPNGIRFVQHPKDIWKPGTILRLFDDNILADPKSFWLVHDVKVRFEYLDIRLVTPELAKGLKEMRHEGSRLIFSFDMSGMEKQFREGVRILGEAGWKPRQLVILMYMHDEAAIPDAMHRWSVIRECGCEPFLMVNNENRTSVLKRIVSRGTAPAYWRNRTTEEIFNLGKNKFDIEAGEVIEFYE